MRQGHAQDHRRSFHRQCGRPAPDGKTVSAVLGGARFRQHRAMTRSLVRMSLFVLVAACAPEAPPLAPSPPTAASSAPPAGTAPSTSDHRGWAQRHPVGAPEQRLGHRDARIDDPHGSGAPEEQRHHGRALLHLRRRRPRHQADCAGRRFAPPLVHLLGTSLTVTAGFAQRSPIPSERAYMFSVSDEPSAASLKP